jgi:hypothetical protein
MIQIWLCFALTQAPRVSEPAPPAALIKVEDTELRIPPLPKSRLDARWHIKDAQVKLEAAAKVVDQELNKLRSTQMAPGNDLTVRGNQVAEAKAMVVWLQTDPYANLTADLVRELEIWEADTTGLPIRSQKDEARDRKGGADLLEWIPIASATKAGQTPIDDRPGGLAFSNLDVSEHERITDKIDTESTSIRNQAMRAGAMRWEDEQALLKHLLTVDRKHEGPVAQRWAAIVHQLGEDAKAVATLAEGPLDSQTAAIVELRRRVKIQFLSRFRAMLRLNQTLWSRLAQSAR